LSRFGNVDSFSRTLAVPARPEPVAGPRPNAALLFIVMHCYFSLFFIVIRAGGNAGQKRAAARHKAKFAAGSNAHIVISLLLTMPRCGSAAHDTKRHRTTSAPGQARVAAPGKMLASILARFGAVLFTMSNSPVRALAAMRLACARRAGPSALGIVSGRPLQMRIFLA
jgi:hypothetical protein